jgi:NADH:ubiquinone oxidoreductase subunit 4 (subunit M)
VSLYLLLIIPLFTTIYIGTNSGFLFQKRKIIVLITFIINFLVSLGIFTLFDLSINEYQFTQNSYSINFYNLYLGIDGISIYFILLTTMIMPIVLISN